MNDVEQETGSGTSSSLLHLVLARNKDAWRRLSELYGPVVYGWVRAAGFKEHDAADIVQDVFQSVFASLSQFRKDLPTDRFRSWLGTIAYRRACDHLRKRAAQPSAAGGSEAQAMLQALPERLSESGIAEDANSHADLIRRALELVRPEFADHTWQACMQTAVEGRRPADVAADLEMTVGAVYVARSRVLKRLRIELEGLEPEFRMTNSK
ncbi:MAG: RNA polymerase sigma factor [Pirellulaceae bacterium]